MATVTAAIHDFTIQYAGAWIIAKGSTLSRTRLYRIGITNHLKEITAGFVIYGMIEEQWEPFEQRRDYQAFLIRRK